LLVRLGGTALLDVFLRDLAKSKGSQRLGKQVRKSLKKPPKKEQSKDIQSAKARMHLYLEQAQ